MADKITEKINYNQGTMGIDEWMRQFVEPQPSINKGFFTLNAMNLDGTIVEKPINRVGILFEDCKFMRQGTNLNHGSGGSNCVTGNPCYFVDSVTFHSAVFKDDYQGILANYKKPCYVLPLAMLDDAPDLVNLMLETYTGFIAQKRGDTLYDESHIANGICCGLAAICYSLCKEITLKGTIRTERISFLVQALYLLSHVARSVNKYSLKCRKIFDLLPKMARTADTFQSILISFIFDRKPMESICVNLLGASILRNARHCKNKSYIEENPIGLIGLLLIAPMLSKIFTESDHCAIKTVNQIVNSIKNAICLIKEELTDHNHSDTDEQNKLILRGFAKASEINLVSPHLIDKIYDAVTKTSQDGVQDIAQKIGIVANPCFILSDVQIMINGSVCKNYPVMIKNDLVMIKNDLMDSEIGQCVTYIPGDPREWTGLILKHDAKYKFEAEPLGISGFKSGNTLGDQLVANFRFTAGNELMRGIYPGWAASGMSYDPLTKKFTNTKNNVDLTGSFEIIAQGSEMLVKQDGVHIFSFSDHNDYLMEPLICFKYCSVKITLIEKFNHIDVAAKKMDIIEPITDQLRALEIPSQSITQK